MTTATRTLYIEGDSYPAVMILCPHGLTEDDINLSKDAMARRRAIVSAERYHALTHGCDCTEIIELARELPKALYSPEYYEAGGTGPNP